MIERAIISVYDKTGLDELVKVLERFNVEIISSGGTAKRIEAIGYEKLIEVSSYTGHPESPGGLVKTLHPKIHGGLLLDNENPQHRKWMKENDVKPIDLVVCNLYPFEKVVSEGAELKTACKNIDIGGPSMMRSAAKAGLLYDSVCIVTSIDQYGEIIQELEKNEGEISTSTRRKLALEAFKRTRNYDNSIVDYLEEQL
jgi:phosphoribosylaminoimidazolecarboxamide formyltransferase/IMP cyclohydrolase